MNDFHSSTQVLSTGMAIVLGREVPAVEVRNLYGQDIVWGDFSVKRGKFKGDRSQNATTENVKYVSITGHVTEWLPPFGDE